MGSPLRELLAEAREHLVEKKAPPTLALPGKPGKWLYKGQEGVWRTTANGNRVFWPDGTKRGDPPLGQAGLGKGGPADKRRGAEGGAEQSPEYNAKKPGLLRRVWNKLKSALGRSKAEAIMHTIGDDQALLEAIDNTPIEEVLGEQRHMSAPKVINWLRTRGALEALDEGLRDQAGLRPPW